MNDDEIRQLLNLPETPAVSAIDSGTFQLDFEQEPQSQTAAPPKDQVISAVASVEQLAMIVCIYYRAKYGVPMPPIVVEPENEPDDLYFHLRTE